MNKKQKILAIVTLGLIMFLLIGNTGKIYAADSPAATSNSSSNPVLTGLDVVGGIAAVPLSLTIIGISLIAGSIASIAVQIGGFLSNFALSLNFAVIQNPIIDVGWKITRDLANLGFVLFIIIIAIATILRMQQYEAKSTLGKLIAVALLVNFSLMFAGVFIDFSNMLTKYFISNITGAGVGGLGTSLAAAFNVGQFLGVKDAADFAANILTFSGAVKIIAGLVFAVVFTLLVALCLIAVAAMFILRYLNLSVLLVLVPLACLSMILPSTESMWKEWWKNFIKWIIFAPVASFFFYLAVYLANNYKTFTGGISLDAQGVGKLNDLMGFGGTPMKDFAGSVINLVIVGGFLMFGLIISDKMGIGGAKTFLNVASAAGKGIKGFAGRKAWEGVGKVTGSEKVKGWTRNLANSKFAPAKWVGQGINRLGAQAERVPAEQYRKQVAGLSPQRLNIEAQAATGIKRAVILEELAKKKDLSTETISKYFSNGATMANVEKDFKTTGLNFGNITKAIGRSVGMVSAKTNDELVAATDEFLKSLDPKDYAKGQWNEIFKTTTDSKLQNIQKQLIGAFARKTPGAFGRVMPHIKEGTVDNYKSLIEKEISFMEKNKDEAMRKLGAQARAVYKKTLGKRLFAEEITPSGSATPPPTT
ncbi:MAG: hypothetical protein Q8N22_02095 [bacterium]|nr:hypothetical protein [bacterium]